MEESNPPVSIPARMTATVVIPVWNGAGVIEECLRALYTKSGDRLDAVVAVDNDSPDESRALIKLRFPQVQVIRSSFNLGFAGGVNLGIAASTSELTVLLNQDCLVDEGWLDALCAAMAADPQAAIGGCTIYNADGTLNHAGATLELPLAYARHLTTPTAAPARVEFVTGAVFAIRRAAWEALGPLDEEFYPAYYEDADYCYRARKQGWGVLYVPAASAHHLQNSLEWRSDPLLHYARQHRARYRFIVKHLAEPALTYFIARECMEAHTEKWLDQTLGRALAARHTLRGLDEALQRRQSELADGLSPADRRRLQVGLARVAQTALHHSYQLAQRNFPEPPRRRLDRHLGLLQAPAVHLPSEVAQSAAKADVLALLAEYEYL